MRYGKGTLPLGKVMLVACLLTLSCNPGGPTEPEPSTANVWFKLDKGAEPAGPLRLAVAWQQSWGANQHWLTTYDAPHQLTQSRQVATLTLPPLSQRAGLSDQSVAYFDCGADTENIEAPVIFPRFIVYEDLDDSGDFNPDLPLAPGIDRVWGVSYSTTSGSLVAAFSDLDQVLSTLPMTAAECLRGFTSGTYSAFFEGVQESATQEAAAHVLARADTPSTFVGLSPTGYAGVLMNCPPGTESPLNVSATNSMYESPRRWVDAAVANDPCAQAEGPCTQGDAASLALPELTNYADRGYQRSAECYVSGSLDVLLLKEFRLVCESCSCHWNELSSSWVVESTSLPKGWPCGALVHYCSTPAASLWVEPSTCSLGSARPQ
jgi:hypothetical protein